jgi:hypothetical protein
VDEQAPSTGTAQKIEAFRRVRLRGRQLPDDLRALLVAYWEDDPTAEPVFRQWELELLDPSETTWLEELAEEGYGTAGPAPVDPADIDAAAVDAGFREVARHLAVLGTWQNSSIFGYWWHPDEPAQPWAPVVQVDSEGEMSVLARDCSLVEALVGAYSGGNDAHFDRLSAILRDAGIPVERRGRLRSRHGHSPELTVDPETLYETVREREVARLTAASQAAVMLARQTPGPDLATLTGVLGRPADHPTVAALLSDLRLPTTVPFDRTDISIDLTRPERGIEITFQRADEIRDERRLGVPPDDPVMSVITLREPGYSGDLPHDLQLGLARTAVHGMLGPPLYVRRADGAEFWEFDRRFVRITYAAAGTVDAVAVGLPWKGFP